MYAAQHPFNRLGIVIHDDYDVPLLCLFTRRIPFCAGLLLNEILILPTAPKFEKISLYLRPASLAGGSWGVLLFIRWSGNWTKDKKMNRREAFYVSRIT